MQDVGDSVVGHVLFLYPPHPFFLLSTPKWLQLGEVGDSKGNSWKGWGKVGEGIK